MQHFGNKLLLLYLISCSFFVAADPPEKPIVVLSTSYNNSKWCEKSIQSILMQEYSNYRIVYVDDCSTDGTASLVENTLITSHKKSDFTLIRNNTRIGSLANMYHAIHGYTEDEEIIVSLDGDDWFFDTQVLKKINKAYASEDIWLTHGTLVEYPGGHVSWSMPIPKEIIKQNTFRQFRCPSHLRTFYSWLFKKIELEDLLYKGSFFPMTGDFAIMFPMIEMAGDRHLFISDVTYVYNMANELNDNKVNAQLQRDLDVLLRNKPPYSRLDKAPTLINSIKKEISE